MNKFISPTNGKLNMKGLTDKLLEFIQEDTSSNYKIMIGTDSCGRGEVNFVTAIILHRIGKGGRYFWSRIKKTNLYSLRHILYEEASLSILTAEKLLKELGKRVDEDITKNLEIHIDVGFQGESKNIVKEIMGMVLSNQFIVKIKPEAVAATIVADKHV